MQEGNIVMTKTKEHMRAMYINNTGKGKCINPSPQLITAKLPGLAKLR